MNRLQNGLKLKQEGLLQDAEKIFRELLQENPGNLTARHHLGNTLIADGRLDDGLLELKRVISVNPQNGLALFNLGCALFQAQHFQEALTAFSAAVVLLPKLIDARINRGSCFHALGRLQEALTEFDLALRQSPDEINCHWQRALTLLTMGRYREGFQGYEWRWKRKLRTRTYPFSFNQPRWQGNPFRNQRLLVYSEQGLGDTLQFIRFLPAVKALGGQLIFEIRPELAQLLANIEGPDELTIFSPKKPCSAVFDIQIPLMSLPNILKSEITSLPKPALLKIDPEKRAFWHQQINTDKINIGLVWAGRPTHVNDHHRSIPLSFFNDLIALNNANFYSLQTGPAAKQSNLFGKFENFFNTAFRLNNFTDTAAIVSELDLVISVDTAVAHLAANLGRPTWVLLSYVPDWRWQRDRSDSLWYPSVTLWRQSQPGDWKGVIKKLTLTVAEQTTSS